MTIPRVSPVKHDVRKMTKERQKARLGFDQRGETIAQWAVTRGFTPAMVSHVLHGHMKCDRGQAHDIAVALGLKPVPASQGMAA